MNWKKFSRSGLLAIAAIIGTCNTGAAEQAYTFNVLNQRSVTLTAQYWNPILIYVSRKSGYPWN